MCIRDRFDIGWEDYLDRGGVCAVEWSENVAEALPEDTVWVDQMCIRDSHRARITGNARRRRLQEKCNREIPPLRR